MNTETHRANWRSAIPQEDREIYRRAGLGASGGIGRRPALLVIDVQYRTIGRRPKPIFEAIQECSTSCGEAGWAALPNIARIIDCFRRLDLPVLYPHIAPKNASDQGAFTGKMPALMQVPNEAYAFVQEVAPRPGDILLPKRHASSFFGTTLASQLVKLGVDSLLFAGCTTSGCVRASVVDACQLNYRGLVLEDAVFDRSAFAHNANLFDMSSKYADVVSTTDAIALVEDLRIGANI